MQLGPCLWLFDASSHFCMGCAETTQWKASQGSTTLRQSACWKRFSHRAQKCLLENYFASVIPSAVSHIKSKRLHSLIMASYKDKSSKPDCIRSSPLRSAQVAEFPTVQATTAGPALSLFLLCSCLATEKTLECREGNTVQRCFLLLFRKNARKSPTVICP